MPLPSARRSRRSARRSSVLLVLVQAGALGSISRGAGGGPDLKGLGALPLHICLVAKTPRDVEAELRRHPEALPIEARVRLVGL